jgi:hypothetical protein
MDTDHPVKRAAAFVAAGLAMAWIGGSVGTAGFMTVYWLLFGAWPETAMYTLVPAAVIRFVLSLPGDDPLRPIFLYLLHQDLLAYILVVPPLLLAPCLAVLLIGQPSPPPEHRVPPFAAPKGSDTPISVNSAFRRNRGMPDSRRKK